MPLPPCDDDAARGVEPCGAGGEARGGRLLFGVQGRSKVEFFFFEEERKRLRARNAKKTAIFFFLPLALVSPIPSPCNHKRTCDGTQSTAQRYTSSDAARLARASERGEGRR